MKPKQGHPMAAETEQLEPGNVLWLFEQGYAEKDKQATRMTEKGIQWLQSIEEVTRTMLDQIKGDQHGKGRADQSS